MQNWYNGVYSVSHGSSWTSMDEGVSTQPRWIGDHIHNICINCQLLLHWESHWVHIKKLCWNNQQISNPGCDKNRVGKGNYTQVFLEYSLCRMRIIISLVIPKQPNITVTSHEGSCVSNAIAATCGAVSDDKVGTMPTLSFHCNELMEVLGTQTSLTVRILIGSLMSSGCATML